MNYSAVSDYHGEARHMQRTAISKHVSMVNFNPEDEVLDVGCGTGEETKVIALQVRSVTGIDPSEDMIDFARRNYNAPNVSYYVDRAETVGDNPELKGRFDKAVIFHILHWIPDELKATTLGSILACLKPGGEALFIAVNRPQASRDAHRFISKHVRWGQYVQGYQSPCHQWNRSVEESVALMTSCGWTKVTVKLEEEATLLCEMRAKLLFKTAAIGETALIPESEQDDFLDDLWRWAFARYEVKSEPGNIILPKENVVIHAYKPF